MEFTFWSVIAVLFATILSDIVWAYYFIKVAQKRPHQASMFAILIALNSSFITISYIGNNYFLIPVIVGSYVGTYLAVKSHIKYDKSDEKIAELERSINYLLSELQHHDDRLLGIEGEIKRKYE